MREKERVDLGRRKGGQEKKGEAFLTFKATFTFFVECRCGAPFEDSSETRERNIDELENRQFILSFLPPDAEKTLNFVPDCEF